MNSDHDFLEGIDEQFQHRMKLYGSGRSSGPSGAKSRRDRLSGQLADLVEDLSTRQKEEMLEFLQTLKAKAEPFKAQGEP